MKIYIALLVFIFMNKINYAQTPENYIFKDKLEMGYQIGDESKYKFNFIGGLQLNDNIFIGMGSGFRYYNDAESLLIPLFVNSNFHFFNSKVISPYISISMGYSFNSTNNLRGVGFLFNPSIGIDYKITKKTSISIGLDYELQKQDIYSGPYNISDTINGTGIVLAISF